MSISCRLASSLGFYHIIQPILRTFLVGERSSVEFDVHGKSFLTSSSSDKMDASFGSIVQLVVAIALIFASLQRSGKPSRTLFNVNDEKLSLLLVYVAF